MIRMRKTAAFAIQVLGLAFLFWSAQPMKLALPWPALAVLAVVYLFCVRYLSILVYRPDSAPLH
jgi:hypothetical protein